MEIPKSEAASKTEARRRTITTPVSSITLEKTIDKLPVKRRQGRRRVTRKEKC